MELVALQGLGWLCKGRASCPCGQCFQEPGLWGHQSEGWSMGTVHLAGPEECACSSGVTNREKHWERPSRCLVGRDKAASESGLLTQTAMNEAKCLAPPCQLA